MEINDMDFDEFFGLEPEDSDENQPEEENEPETPETVGAEDGEAENEQEDAEPAEDQGELSDEQRHKNAARRRAAEIRNVRREERNRNTKEWDDFVKGLGLKNPFDGNKPIETKEQYDAFKKLQDEKALERGLSSGSLTAEQFNAAVDARIAASAPAPAAAAQPNYEEVDRQFAEIQAFDPSVKDLDSLVKGEKSEAFLSAVERTGNMLDAYKLVYFDELQARQAQAGKLDAANRAQEKAHLQRTGARGSGSVEVTNAMRDMYRVFDPDITDDEIRKYETKDAKVRKT